MAELSSTAMPSDGDPIIKDLPAPTNIVADSSAAESSSPASICNDRFIGLLESRLVTLIYFTSSTSNAPSATLVALRNVATVVSTLAGQVTTR